MSHCPTDYSQPRSSPAERILTQLKTHGPQNSAALGRGLEITGEAVRQQLQRLAVDGLVQASTAPAGVGRPALTWRLTRQGHERFPDGHGVLMVKLLQNIREQFGDAGMQKLLQARQHDACSSYGHAMSGADTLAARVARLAEIRTGEGYMCNSEPQQDGTWLLTENHCPICAAAAACPQLCQSELALFQDVLGKQAHVERVEHLQSGGRRCTYRIALAC